MHEVVGIRTNLVTLFWLESHTYSNTNYSLEELRLAQSILFDILNPKEGNAPKKNIELKRYLSVLLGLRIDPLLEEQFTKEIRKKVLWKRLSNLPHDRKELSSLLTVLVYLIDYGNHKKLWDNAFQPTLELVPVAIPPCNSMKKWNKGQFVEKLTLAFELDFQSSLRKKTKDKWWLARSYFSLLADSYLINEKNFGAITKSIFDVKNWHYQGRMAFIELPFYGINPRNKCFIAPQTELCFAHLSRIPTEITPSRIVKEMTQYFIHLKFDMKHAPTSIKGWINFIKQHLNNQLQALNLAIASNKFQSCSLQANASNRLLNTQLDNILPSVKREIAVNDPEKGISLEWKNIRSILNHQGRENVFKEVHKNINSIICEVDPKKISNTILLLQWGKQLLPSESSKSRTPAPASVLSKLDTIGKKIFSVADADLVIQYNPNERSRLHQQVLDLSESPRNFSSIQYVLKSFEDWLIKEKNVSEVPDYDELFAGAKSAKESVNANVISHDEYEYTTKYLEEKYEVSLDNNNQLVLMMRLFLIFGFRLGLRKSEVAEIKSIDYIFCAETPQIVIRESYDRYLKTTNAKRTFFLKNFLTPEELTLFNDYYLQHHENCSSDERYFFSLSDSFSESINAQSVVDNLMNVLRQVARDPAVKFHQLRHSFASWHMLSAISAELSLDITEYFVGNPKTQHWLNLDTCKERKLKHLRHNRPSRKYPYWLQKHMGHSSIETTLSNYIHFMDVSLSSIQCRFWLMKTAKELSEYTHVSIDLLKKNKSMKGIHAILAKYRKKSLFYNKDRNKKNPQWQPPNDIKSFLDNPLENLTPYKCYCILNMMVKNTHSESLSYQLGWEEERIDAIKHVYKTEPKLCAKKTTTIKDDDVLSLVSKINQHYDGAYQDDKLFQYSSLYSLTLIQIMASLFARLKSENRKAPMGSTFARIDGENHRTENKPYYQHSLVMIFGSTDICDVHNIIGFIKTLNLKYKLILRHSSERSPKDLLGMKQQWREHLQVTKRIPFGQLIDSDHEIGKIGRLEICVLNKKGKYHSAFYFLVAHTLSQLVAQGEI